MADNKNGGGDGMVSQRSENSVLFSLSNLTAISDDSGSPQSQAGYASSGSSPSSSGGGGGGGAGENMGDKSGLIDLATLTALGAGDQAGGEKAGGGGGDANSAAVPALFNVDTRKSSTGAKVGIFLLVLIVLGLGGFVAYLQFFKEEPAEPVVEELDPAIKEAFTKASIAYGENKARLETLAGNLVDEGQAKQIADKIAQWQPVFDAAIKKGEEEALVELDPLIKEMAAFEAGTKEWPTKLDALAAEKDALAKAQAEAAANANANATPEEEDKDKDKGKSSSSSSKSRDKDKDKDDGPKSASDRIKSGGGGDSGKKLTQDDVLTVISAKTIKIRRCGSGGDLQVSWTITKSGGTSGVKAFGGSLKGSDAEKCVIDVVKGMKFPSSSAETPIKYPFKL